MTLKQTIFFMILLLAWTAPVAQAQPLTDAVRVQGYVHQNDTTYFVFDAEQHGVKVTERVVVTGAFQNWDQDMESRAWRLSPQSVARKLWVLPVPNPDYSVIGPSTPFKFRIDDGQWLDPPAAAPNLEAGNLVFLYGTAPPRLKAELHGPRTIWAWISGDDLTRPLDSAAYRLVDAHGNIVPIEAIIPNTASKTLVVPAEDLDIRRVYYLEVPRLKLRTRCRFDGWFRSLYSDKVLGANIHDGNTTFRILAPRAEAVRLYLYNAADAAPEAARETIDMVRDDVGVWEAVIEGDLHGTYYDFTVQGPDDPGNFFYETHPVHISDPYARVNVDAQGKSRVWRPTTPAAPLADGRPKMEDVIAYEVHVQDFTDRLPVSDDLKGTIPAMVTPGLTNSQGEPVGFDYLVDLGINVVHLMPVQEFLHYPDDEWQAAFKDDSYMMAQGVNLENYQWGYRTTHAFAIETRFRRKGTEHGAQRDQFRDLVQAFHDKGIAVIIDLVPNHTGENMDGRHYLFNFNALDKPFYYRTDEQVAHIGPFGNEVKTEDRPMVQRWVIDQCRSLVDEFGIDGFRIDLAGQIDKQTLVRLREELGDDVIIYGEAWIPPSDPDVVANKDWSWYKADAPITYFQDDARNAFKGPVSNPQDPKVDRGYPGGDTSLREQVMGGLLNSFLEEIDPNRGINYLDIHDNWALADRFATTNWDGRQGVNEAQFKIAAGLLFTSLGPLVLHGGTEIMRSKGAAPLEEIVKETASGKLEYHGKRDTYNLRVANQFVWENVGKTSANAPNDYANMLAYWKGLIALRISAVGQVFRIGTAPPDGYYQWFLPDDAHLLGYLVDNRVLVLINTSETLQTFEDIALPEGDWQLIANADQVNPANGLSGDGALLEGGETYTLSVPAVSLKIWTRN